MGEENKALGLREVLKALSDDLVAARDRVRQDGGGYGLVVGNATVELAITFTNEKGADGRLGIRAWVIDASLGGSGKRSETNSHKITLTLVPELEGDSDDQEDSNAGATLGKIGWSGVVDQPARKPGGKSGGRVAGSSKTDSARTRKR